MVDLNFPKTMVHPHFRKGEAVAIPGTGRQLANGQMLNPSYQGIPDRFPPVIVNNADQEERERARGYLPFGEKAPPMVDYAEFPLTMIHPGHVPEVPAKQHIKLVDGRQEQWTDAPVPAVLPPVIIHTSAEEPAWMAKGYRRAGTSDPAAVESAKASPYVAGRVTHEFPKMVDGKIVDPNAVPGGPAQYPKWVIDRVVNTPEEEFALRALHGVDQPAAPVIVAPAPAPPALNGSTTSVVQISTTEAAASVADTARAEGFSSASEPPALTRGQKAAATRAANKAAKAEQHAAR